MIGSMVKTPAFPSQFRDSAIMAMIHAPRSQVLSRPARTKMPISARAVRALLNSRAGRMKARSREANGEAATARSG